MTNEKRRKSEMPNIEILNKSKHEIQMTKVLDFRI